MMWVAKTVGEIRQRRQRLTGTVALVPTMGALHEGHTSLIRDALRCADHVLVSIFVNPTQFNRPDDFESYPRTAGRDLEACEAAGAAGVFMPAAEEIYPATYGTCEINVPALADDLEGKHRPGHFGGVCRVVAKLLNIVQPAIATFGAKDYQQLKIIQAMVADLAMPVRIDAAPTVREPDGLAMSSRNSLLETQDRARAVGFYKALREAKRLVEQGGEPDPRTIEAAMHQILTAYRIQIDYAQVRHPHTLGALDCIEPSLTGGVVALVAGTLGTVRLIDNMLLGELQPVSNEADDCDRPAA